MILGLVDGTSFFVGLALALAANLLLLRYRHGLKRSTLTVVGAVGVGIVVISGTPLPLWAYGLWLLAVVATPTVGNAAGCPRQVRLIPAGVAVLTTAAFALMEVPYRRLPQVNVQRGATVYVLGDSLSAGMGTEHRCWPAVLAGMTPFPVVNLAQPGATCQSVLKQAEGIGSARGVVIVEIGGNDLFSSTGASAFRDQLDRLLASLRAQQHQVLMLELPLFPLRNAFGAAQRDLAAKYGVALLPKRCFAAVLGTRNATLDGLHLSQVGHDAMARVIARVVHEEQGGVGTPGSTEP